MRIRKICGEFGIKDPVFKEIGQGFQVVLFKEKINDTDNDIDRRKRILHIIENNPTISIIILAQKLSVSKSTVLRDTRMLKLRKKLIRIGKEKNGYWKVVQE